MRTFDDLTKWLTERNVPHSADPKAEAIVFPSILRDEHSQGYLRFHGDRGLVLCIQPIPLPESPDWNALAEAVLRINHSLPLPGFGVDHDENLLYFRYNQVFDPEAGIHPEEVQHLISYTLNSAARFLLVLRQVGDGTLPAAQVVEASRIVLGDPAES